jgi:ATP-dependent DNA helicase RecQ
VRTLGSPTILALTATAPPEVVDDITRQLAVGSLQVVNTGLHRPNLMYRVLPVTNDTDKQRQLLGLIRDTHGAVIVYAATVRHVEELADVFKQQGVPAVAYHGRMRARDRSEAQDAFMTGTTPVIVATNAFGMGIDRPDIRAVIHYDVPASLDVYYQESGRAGRDGLDAQCVLLFQRSDRRLQTFFMAGRYPSRDDFQALRAGLAQRPSPDALSFREVRDAAASVSVAKLRVMLTVLKEARLIRQWRGSRYGIPDRFFTESLDALAQAYDERRGRDQGKLEQMVVYAQTALCRSKMILNALGDEPDWESCGTCDNCTGAAVRPFAMAEGAA